MIREDAGSQGSVRGPPGSIQLQAIAHVLAK